MQDKLAFNPRKMSVAMVEAELGRHPNLTIDQIKALLAHEGSQYRPREGVERLLDARLLALAEEAIEAASDDMVAEGAPDEEVSYRFIIDAEGSDQDPVAPIDDVSDEEVERQPTETITDHVGRMAVVQGVKDEDEALDAVVDAALAELLGRMTAERLAGFGLCRMMGPDPDRPMEPEGSEEETAWDYHLDCPACHAVLEITGETPRVIGEQGSGEEPAPAIAVNTPVHVTMTNGDVHEGYYLRPQPGAMIRMRDGHETIIYVPDHDFRVSPSDD